MTAVQRPHRVNLVIHPQGKVASCPCGWRVQSRGRRDAMSTWLLQAIMRHGREGR